MATALCRRPEPLGAGERSLIAAPGATIRCGASRQPPRRLGGGCHAPGASRSLPPPTAPALPGHALGSAHLPSRLIFFPVFFNLGQCDVGLERDEKRNMRVSL
ncbi:uncharacterized protein [Macaca fascicularis]|uniref:uncharacterized protein n=1 Tax=Macaca fascicularis TaxID=9541 RepID=UPI0032B05A64